MHDVGLTRIPRNTMCFEVEGAEIARRFLERHGMPADDADRVAIAIILHMQPSVTLDDGVEAVLLDRATSLDVRGEGYALVDAVRPGVMRDVSRDAPSIAASSPRSRREAAVRPDLPERPAAPSDRARRLDGALAVGDRDAETSRWPLTAAPEPYPPIEPYETGHARRRRRPIDLLGGLGQPGRQARGRAPRRARAAAAARDGAAGSIRRATGSSSSTSAAAAGARRTPATSATDLLDEHDRTT